jgi:hypothetical protein
MNDEYKVIHEGVTFQNVHGNCISHGENIEILASKTPLYDGSTREDCLSPIRDTLSQLPLKASAAPHAS